MDYYECPLQVIENYESSGSFGWKSLVGKHVTKKPRPNILKFFGGKNYLFYLRRVIFLPEDYTFNIRMKDDEIKLRYYQAIFDLKVENIILPKAEYVIF